MLSERKGSKESRAQARAAATQEVVVELRTLRASLDVMSEQYRVRVAGQLAELLRPLEGDPDIGVTPRRLTLAAARDMLKRIEGVELKPKRGRSKDFSRLEALVAELTELVPPER